MQATDSAAAADFLDRLIDGAPYPGSWPGEGRAALSCTQPCQKMPGAPEAGEAGDEAGEKEAETVTSVLPPPASPWPGGLVRKVRAARRESGAPALTGQPQIGPVSDGLVGAVPASLFPAAAWRPGRRGPVAGGRRRRFRDSTSSHHDSSSLYTQRHGIDCECVAQPLCQMWHDVRLSVMECRAANGSAAPPAKVLGGSHTSVVSDVGTGRLASVSRHVVFR
jgi:hypothetical protein